MLLQVFKLDFSSNSHELPVAGQAVTAPERFYRLSWNAFVFGTPEQEKFPVSLHFPERCITQLTCLFTQHSSDVQYMLQHGLIAGGLADGSIALWDAHQIIRGRSEGAQLAKETKHHGAVSQ